MRLDKFLYLAVEIFLRNMKLPGSDFLPQVFVNFSAAHRNFREQNIPVRKPFAVKIMIRNFITLPAVIVTETLQISPARHVMSSRSFLSGDESILITYGICSLLFGADDHKSNSV